jgi:hypothetical protein
MVAVPGQLGMPAAYMLGTAELAKAVLAGEGDITQTGVQHNYGLFTLVGQHSLLMVQEPRHKVGVVAGQWRFVTVGGHGSSIWVKYQGIPCIDICQSKSYPIMQSSRGGSSAHLTCCS